MKPTAASDLVAVDAGSPAALEIEQFEQLVRRHRSQVLRFVFASVRDMDLAETLTQDCFWKAYRHRDSFRSECSTQTWLMRIAINLVRDHTRNRRFQFWRKARVVPDTMAWEAPDRDISPEEKAVVNDQVQAVWEATGTLSERQRTVFLLRFVEDLDIGEIAQACGLTENAVNVHLFRAVRSIRKRLGNVR